MTKEAVMETPKVKCVKCAIRPTYIDKPPVVVNDFAANAMDTPATAIPTANVERVREVMRSAMLTAHQHNKSFCFGDFATCHNCKDWREALALLEPHT